MSSWFCCCNNNDLPLDHIAPLPMVAFRLSLHFYGNRDCSSYGPSSSAPSFQLVLCGARNLPTTLNGNIIEAYKIKVQQFPESKQFETCVKQGTDFSLDESFQLPLKRRQICWINVWKTQESANLKEVMDLFGSESIAISVIGYRILPSTTVRTHQDESIPLLGHSGSKSTIGCVKYSFERIPFIKISNNQFDTPEILLPLNILSREEFSKRNLNNKIELTLQFCYNDPIALPATSFSIVATKLRCCTQRINDYKSAGFGKIRLKITVWKGPFKAVTWKSELFVPQFSQRWHPTDNLIAVPLKWESLNQVRARIAIKGTDGAGKEKLLEELFLGPKSPQSNPFLKHHWDQMVAQSGLPVTMWHRFG